MSYDPDRFDAEIVLDRSGLTAPFTTDDVCLLLGRSQPTVSRWIAKGKIPAPAIEGRATDRRTQDAWSYEQMIEMLMGVAA